MANRRSTQAQATSFAQSSARQIKHLFAWHTQLLALSVLPCPRTRALGFHVSSKSEPTQARKAQIKNNWPHIQARETNTTFCRLLFPYCTPLRPKAMASPSGFRGGSGGVSRLIFLEAIRLFLAPLSFLLWRWLWAAAQWPFPVSQHERGAFLPHGHLGLPGHRLRTTCGSTPAAFFDTDSPLDFHEAGGTEGSWPG